MDIFEQYQKNHQEIEKHCVDDYERRHRIEELDDKIWKIQKSTKASFGFLTPIHDALRNNSIWYYNWHTSKLATYLNPFITIASIVIIFIITGYMLGFLGQKESSQAATGIPKMIHYQGKLTNPSNVPVVDGDYDFVVRIYDSQSGGSCLWAWKGTCGTPTAVTVPVANSIFSVLLGDTSFESTNALDLSFNDDSYWLQVEVEGETLLPRRRVGAVGYAYNSDTVDGRHENEFALLAGRSSGQTLIGGTGVADDLILQATSGVGESGSDIIFKVGNNGVTEAMRILYDGKVGIGTSSPDEILHVKDSTADSSPAIKLENDAKAWRFIVDGSDSDILKLQETSDSNANIFQIASDTQVLTFFQFPITPSSAPTTDYQVANKKYVDDSNYWERIDGGGGLYVLAPSIDSSDFIMTLGLLLAGGLDLTDTSASGDEITSFQILLEDSVKRTSFILDYTEELLIDSGFYDTNKSSFRVSTSGGSHSLFIKGSDGNIGINNTTPSRKLDILDSTDPQLRLTSGTGIYTDFQTTSSGYLYINPSGNRIGVGIENPNSLLELSSINSNPILTITNASDSEYDPSIEFRVGETPVTTHTLGVDDSDSNKFKISSGSALGTNDLFIVDLNGARINSISGSTVQFQYQKSGTTIWNSFVGSSDQWILKDSTNNIILIDKDLTWGRMTMDSTETILNAGLDAVSFRVKTDTNSNMFFVDGTNNRIGVNTATPSGNLHVASANYTDTLLAERTTSNTNLTRGVMRVKHTSTGDMANGFGTKIYFQIQDVAETANDIASIGAARNNNSDSTGDLFFTTYSAGSESEKMRILYDGKVGIGTSSPDEILHVKDSTADSSPAIKLENDAKAWRFIVDGSDSDILKLQETSDSNANIFQIASDTQVLTFSQFPITPSSAPTTDYQVANKKYVDDSAGANTSLSNLSSVAINTHLLPDTDDTYNLGSNDYRWANLYLGGESIYIGASGDQSVISYVASSDLLKFQNSVDSATGFQFLDADGGTPILNIDTTNERVGIGTASPSTAFEVLGDIKISGSNSLILGSASSAPTGTNGAMYYDTVLKTIRGYIDGSWIDIGSGGGSTNYGLKEDEWKDTGSTLPGGLYWSQLAVIGDYIYMFGGANTNVIYRAPVSNPTSWSNTGSTIPGNLNYSQLAIIGDYVYLFGGDIGGSETNVIYRAPVSNPTSWSNTGSTIPGNLARSQLAVIGDYVYLFGGTTSGSNPTNVIYRAPVSNPTSWSNTGSTIPGNLASSQLAIIGNNVYLFGGIGAGSNVIYRAPVSNPTSWSNTGSTLPGNLSVSQLAIIGDYVYLFGGHNGSNVTNVIYRAPVSNPTSWSNTGSTLNENVGYSQLAIISDYVYLFGGESPNYNKIRRAPVYNPSPNLTGIGTWKYQGQESYGSSLSFVQGGNSFSALTVLGTNDAQSLSIKTNNNERIRIDTSGNVGIGTSSPGYKLEVASGDIGLTGSGSDILWGTDGGGNIGASGANRPDYIYTNKIDVASADIIFSNLGSGSGTDIVVDGSGKLLKKSSSKEYKENIIDLSIDTSKIYDLNPVEFLWKDQQIQDFGLIAEDVYQLIPEMVNLDKNNNPISVKYDQLSVLLLSEMKKNKINQDLNTINIQNLSDNLLDLQNTVEKIENKDDFESITVTTLLAPENQDLTIAPATGKTKIIGELEVTEKITINKDIEIKGHIIGNNDTRGQVVVKEDEMQVEHTFETPYLAKPSIIASQEITCKEEIQGDGSTLKVCDPIITGNYALEIYEDKFILHLSEKQTFDAIFNWLVQQ